MDVRRIRPLILPPYPRRNRYAPKSSEQAPYPSLPPGGGSSLTPLLLLFARQTLRWFAARVRPGVTALRSAPRSSAFGGRFDARSARGIFPAAQKVNCPKGARETTLGCVAGKNDLRPRLAAEGCACMGNRFCYRNCNTLRRRSVLQFRDFFQSPHLAQRTTRAWGRSLAATR